MVEPMNGSTKQIQWAEKIRADLSERWLAAMNNIVNAGCSSEFREILDTVYATALEQPDAQVWIEHRAGAMYSIATQGRKLGDMRRVLGWSIDEETLIGFGTLDRICDYDV